MQRFSHGVLELEVQYLLKALLKVIFSGNPDSDNIKDINRFLDGPLQVPSG